MTPEERAKALVDRLQDRALWKEALARPGEPQYAFVPEMAAMIRDAVSAEREACAKVAEIGWNSTKKVAWKQMAEIVRKIAATIRARGQVGG